MQQSAVSKYERGCISTIGLHPAPADPVVRWLHAYAGKPELNRIIVAKPICFSNEKSRLAFSATTVERSWHWEPNTVLTVKLK
jgi:hypothetical protein